MNEKQSNPIIYLLIALATLFIIIAGLKANASILNPILLAIVITIVILPIPQKLTRKGLPGWLAVVLTLVAVIGSIALLVLLFALAISEFNGDSSNPISALGQFSAPPNQLTLGSTSSDLILSIIGVVGHFIVQLGIVLLIFIFMVSTAISMPAVNRLGLRANSPAIERITELTHDVRHYLSIMTGVNFLVGVGDTIFLMILGVEYAVIWGILAWAMGYIPTIGFWIALIPPFIIAWTQIGPETALIVLAGYVLINGSVQNFVQPRLMGRGLGITPLVVFLSLIVWSWLLGGVGAILAVPLTMIIISILDSFDGTRWMATLMRLPPDQDNEDHQAAQEKMRGLWGQTKQIFRGNSSD
jgi:predicted PurR-regulated permease PerM